MNVTLDGFMAGCNGELDWHFNYWNEEIANYADELLSNADTILSGRVTYEAMAQYWPFKIMDLSFPRADIHFAERMNSYTKIVFSKTLTTTGWNNSRLVNGNIEDEITQLKQEPGKNIIIYGSGSIVAALMKLGLIDEYVLWVHPVVLGNGKSLFKVLYHKLTLKLLNAKTFSSGVVILHYKTVNQSKRLKNLNYKKIFLER